MADWIWGFVAVVVCVCVLCGLVAGGCYVIPQYRVWERGLAGQAELRQAESNRKIAIQEAEAKREAAKALAEAEVERARGVAQANQIIGKSLHENEEYLRYLWIQELAGAGHVIYVPTEANLPLMLEAGRGAQEKGESR